MNSVTLDIILDSGTYTVSFSDDPENPQDLAVRDEQGIRGLPSADLAQLYAIQGLLHSLGSSSDATLFNKISRAENDLRAYERALIELGNDPDGTLQQKLQTAQDNLEQQTIDRLKVFGDALASAATVAAAQWALAAFLGVAAAPVAPVALGILAVSSAIKAWELVQSEHDNGMILILAEQGLKMIELAHGSDAQPGLDVALAIFKDLHSASLGQDPNFQGEGIGAFSLDDFKQLEAGTLTGDTFGMAAIEFAKLIASIDGSETDEPLVDLAGSFIAAVTPTNLDDAVFVVADVVNSIGDFLEDNFPPTKQQAVALGEAIDEKIKTLANINTFSDKTLAQLEDLARAYIVRGTAEDDFILGSIEADKIHGGGGADTVTGGEGADIFLGTFAELDGDTITDLEVGDRIFYEGVTFDANAISIDDSSITVSLSGLTTQVFTAVPGNSIIRVTRGVDFNGNTGTVISIDETLNPKRFEIETNAGARTPDGDHDGESFKATESDFISSHISSAAIGGVSAQSAADFLSLTVSASNVAYNYIRSYSGADASIRDYIWISNPSIEEGEVWSFSVRYSVEADYGRSLYGATELAGFHMSGASAFSFTASSEPGNSIRQNYGSGGYSYDYFSTDSVVTKEIEVIGPNYQSEFYLGARSHRTSTTNVTASVDFSLPSGAVLSSASGSFLGHEQYLPIVGGSDAPYVLFANEVFADSEAFEPGDLVGNTRLNGSDGDDTLTDTDGHNQFEGGNGDDVMRSGDGNDVNSGGSGRDAIESGSGIDYVDGGADDDRIVDGDGHDLLLGGTGGDVIILEGSGYHGAGYVAFNVSSDTQVGTQERVRLEGLVRIEAVTDGGEGFDTVQLSDEGDAFFLHDAFSGFHSSVDLEGDYIGRDSAARFAGIEVINGMGGDDIIDLTSPDYSLAGTSLEINGGSGRDIIWGSDADETIFGGAGDDTIFGGTGNDVVSGGLGADVFEFTRTSTGTTIADFDLLEGDSLRFYNTGGAEFLADSAALTDTGGQISYVDTATGQTHVLDIAITFENRDDYPRLGSLSDVFEII